jgi:hypothetical protein
MVDVDDLDDLRFSLTPGSWGDHCYCCEKPLGHTRGAYEVTVDDLERFNGPVAVRDDCARRFVPELLSVRELANELYHLRRALAETSRKPAETTLPGPAAADVPLTADPPRD